MLEADLLALGRWQVERLRLPLPDDVALPLDRRAVGSLQKRQ